MAPNPSSRWTIRTAVAADNAAIAAMSDAIQRYERTLVGYPLLEPAQVSPDYLAGMRNRVAERDGEILVSVDRERIIGFACGYRAEDDDELVDAEFNQFALLADLFVEPDYRAQGVAQALMNDFASRMRDKGCNWLRICAKSGNRRAIDAYLRFGFEAYETIFTKAL